MDSGLPGQSGEDAAGRIIHKYGTAKPLSNTDGGSARMDCPDPGCPGGFWCPNTGRPAPKVFFLEQARLPVTRKPAWTSTRGCESNVNWIDPPVVSSGSQNGSNYHLLLLNHAYVPYLDYRELIINILEFCGSPGTPTRSLIRPDGRAL